MSQSRGEEVVEDMANQNQNLVQSNALNLDSSQDANRANNRSLGSESDEVSSSILDCPICLQPSVHPVELPCSHIFCFLCIKGVATQGGQQPRCAICRSNIPTNVLTNPRLKDISQLYKIDKSNGYHWYYESRSGGWWQYEERTMQELEKAFEAKQSTCQLCIAGHMYDIDFTQMMQYRTGNHSLFRRIKRDAPGGEIRGIAGIRMAAGPNAHLLQLQHQNHSGRRRNVGRGSTSTTPTANLGPAQRNLVSTTTASISTPVTVDSTNVNSSPRVSPIDSQQSDQEGLDSEQEEEVFVDPDEDEDEENHMELGEEEESSETSETDVYNDDELRDGARAPTSRSDRSTSSFNQTPPPSALSCAAGGPASGRKSSKCSNRSTPPTASTPNSGSSAHENANISPSAMSPSVAISTSNISSPVPAVQTVTTANNGVLASTIQISPNLRITVDYNTNSMDEDEIL